MMSLREDTRNVVTQLPHSPAVQTVSLRGTANLKKVGLNREKWLHIVNIPLTICRAVPVRRLDIFLIIS